MGDAEAAASDASPFAQLSLQSQDRDGVFSRASAVFAVASAPPLGLADLADEARLGPYVVTRRSVMPGWVTGFAPPAHFPHLSPNIFAPLMSSTSADAVLANFLTHQRLVFGDPPEELRVSNSAKRWRKDRLSALTQALDAADQAKPVEGEDLAMLLEQACEDNTLASILTAVLVLCQHPTATFALRPLSARFVDLQVSAQEPMSKLVELILQRVADVASVYASAKGDPPRLCVASLPQTFLLLHALFPFLERLSPPGLAHALRILSVNMVHLSWAGIPLENVGLASTSESLGDSMTSLRAQMNATALNSQLYHVLSKFALDSPLSDVQDEAACALVLNFEAFVPVPSQRLALLLDLLQRSEHNDASSDQAPKGSTYHPLLERICACFAHQPELAGGAAALVPLASSLIKSLSGSGGVSPSKPPDAAAALLKSAEEPSLIAASPPTPPLLPSTPPPGVPPASSPCLVRRASTAAANMGRIHLLRGIQGLIVAKHATQSPSPDSSKQFCFEESRMAETIQLSMEGRRATQRAEKKWGTVASSTPLTDAERIHRWKVHVDKCEEGHVFFGVVAKGVSYSSYLGEDQYGWGFIGKAHIWHHHEKRGAYGEPVRTGDVIVCTLDTRRGTLSFASLTRDFGVAFRGLKDYCSHGNALYPAVALYERGDQVTMHPCGGGLGQADMLGFSVAGAARWTACDGPRGVLSAMALADRACQLIKEGINEELLTHTEALLTMATSSSSASSSSSSSVAAAAAVAQNALALHLLPSLLSYLCLWPQSLVSPRVAVRLYPTLLRFLDIASDAQKSALPMDLSGEWLLQNSEGGPSWRAQLMHDVPSGSIVGSLQGGGKLTGNVYMCNVVLVDTSARTYRLRIMPSESCMVGLATSPPAAKAPRKRVVAIRAQVSLSAQTRALEAACATLLGKVCAALMRGQADDDEAESAWSRAEMFRGGLHGVESHIASRLATFGSPTEVATLKSLLDEHQLFDDAEDEGDDFVHRFSQGECPELDRWLLRFSGQAGLAAVGGPSLARARFMVCAALIKHSGLHGEAQLIESHFVATPGDEQSVDDEAEGGAPHPSRMLVNCWRAALKVMGWAVALKQSTGLAYEIISEPLVEKAKLLLRARRLSFPVLDFDLTPASQPSNSLASKLALYKREAKYATRGALQTHSAVVEPIVTFFQDSKVDLAQLEAAVLDRAWSAVFKAAALRGIHVALQSHKGSSASCIVQWVAVGLRDAPCPLANMPDDEGTSSKFEPASTAPQPSAADFEDLGMAPLRASKSVSRSMAHSAQIVRPAFEELFRLLVAMLVDATSAGRTDDQFALLDAWGFVLDQKDHVLLAECRLFFALQGVLDKSRARSGAVRADDLQGWALRRVVDSAMQLLQLVSHQVVLSDLNDQQSLGSNLFDIILAELRDAVPLLATEYEKQEDFVFHLLDLVFSIALSGGEYVVQLFLCSESWVSLVRCCALTSANAAPATRLCHRSLRLLGRMLVDAAEANPSIARTLLQDLAECSNHLTKPTQSFASRMFAASELVTILRKLLDLPHWQPCVTDALIRAGSAESPDELKWAAIAVLGGFVEPVRPCGTVRLQSLWHDGAMEAARGVVVAVERAGLKVSVPYLPSHEAEEEDTLGQHHHHHQQQQQQQQQHLQLHNQRAMGAVFKPSIVVVEGNEVVAVSEVLPPSTCPLDLSMLWPSSLPEALDSVLRLHIYLGIVRVAQLQVCVGAITPTTLSRLLHLAVAITPTGGVADAFIVQKWWRVLSEAYFERARGGTELSSPSPPTPPPPPPSSSSSAQASQVPPGNRPTPPPSATTQTQTVQAVAAVISPALEQMLALDLGFPRIICELALERCSDNVEAAINFCLEHGADLERMQLQRQDPDVRRANVMDKLKEMGFPVSWCQKAYDAVGNDGFDACLTWILANGDALDDQDRDDASSPKTTEAPTSSAGAKSLVCTSGHTEFSADLTVSVKGTAGGFPSVRARGIVIHAGAVYYEVDLMSDGCMQVGWVDASFTGDVAEGNGVGDDAHSWAFDGYRKLKWHEISSSWGRNWKSGDTIGCAVDLDQGEMWFSLNGSWTDGMGLAFRFSKRELMGGLIPAASLNRTERFRFNFGGPENQSLKFSPPPQWSHAVSVFEATTRLDVNVRAAHAGVPPGMDKDAAEQWLAVDDCMEELIGDALADRFFPDASSKRSASASTSPPIHIATSGGGLIALASSGVKKSSSSSSSQQHQPSDALWSPGLSLSGAAVTFRQAVDEIGVLPPASRESEAALLKCMQVTCGALSTLYARMAILALVCRWPDFSDDMHRLLGTTLVECGPLLLTIFKLLPHRPDHEVLLDRPSWRPGLSMRFLFERLFQLLPEKQVLVPVLVKGVSLELAQAARREFAMVPWDDDVLSPRALDAILAAAANPPRTSNEPFTDANILAIPSVRLAVWATEVLLSEFGLGANSVLLDESGRPGLIADWACSMRSPGVSLKMIAAKMLSWMAWKFGPVATRTVLEVVDQQRVQAMARSLMLRGGTGPRAMHSKLVLALVELTAVKSSPSAPG